VKTIDEGIEVLTGVLGTKARRRYVSGRTVNYFADKRLRNTDRMKDTNQGVCNRLEE
jgi:hypothetical protein